MYAGLTIANKPALLDAKARGAEWVARDASGIVCGYKTKPVKVERDREWYTDDGFVLDMHKGMKFVKWSDPEPVNIDLALAQIAEMEKAQAASPPTPLTVNDWLNQATPEQKAEWLLLQFPYLQTKAVDMVLRDNINGIFSAEYKRRVAELLNSPYTEGEADEG